ncbi:MAG: CRISPR-associated RAMP protein Csx10 [Actinomycetota bacterium]
MKQILLTIKALSPLAIGLKKPGSVSEANDYIPGAAIRGAIAAAMLQQSGQPKADFSQGDNDFKTLFLGEKAAVFCNAYPIAADSETEVRVLPSTAVSSKTNPGFKPKGNGVFDTLIDRFCAEGYGQLYDPNCPVDWGRVEPHSAFYSLSKDKFKSESKFKSHSVDKRILTRVGINRRRATAEEEILYSLEVLSEVQGKDKEAALYQSSIFLEDEELANLLVQFINSHSFRLGGAASRGLGKVEIQAEVREPQETVNSRIGQFNEALISRWNSWEIFGQPQNELDKNRTYFTLDLQSDAILEEDWRRTTVITPEMLCDFAGASYDSLQLHVAYSSYDYRSGWNSAWGLMKDVELITNKGAVYLFSTAAIEKWIPALQTLEFRGVGERTEEGFGQLQVCNEFHLVFREDAV